MSKKQTFYPLKKSLFIITFLCVLVLHCQNYSVKYPNENVVTLQLSRHIKISNKKEKINITEHVIKKNFYVTTKQLSLAKENINYNSFNSIEAIEATTYNGNKATSVNKFIDKDVLINGIFFNDQKQKNFSYPNIQKGSITKLKYTKSIKDPHFIPAFIIGQNTPIIQGEFSVSVPKNVEITYKTFNIDPNNTVFKIVKNEKETIYKWTLNSIPKISRYYDFSPLYYIPQIIIYIKHYTHKGKKTNILSNPEDLYNWYNALIYKNGTKSSSVLKKITLDLIKGLTTNKEKAEKIYYFVQENINYIAFEDGLNGFIPRDAFQVYLKKYGDCKDMANVLNEMLKYANIKSGLTWIGTRNKPYSYYDVPTPITDNHMITTVFINEKPVFLDATSKYLTYGLPSPFIQGKEALIGKGLNNFEIIKVPEVPAKNNVTEIISNMYLDSTNLVLLGTHKAKLSGYEKLEFLHKLKRKQNKNLSFLYYQLKYGKKQSNFTNIQYNHLNIAKPYLEINFSTKTKDYIKKIDNTIYIKPNFDYNFKKDVIKAESKNYDKKIDYKLTKKFLTKFTIPTGYVIETLPNNVTLNNELFSFSTSYTLTENKKTIEIKKEISLNTLIVKPIYIEQWNHFIKTLNKSNKQNFILKKQF